MRNALKLTFTGDMPFGLGSLILRDSDGGGGSGGSGYSDYGNADSGKSPASNGLAAGYGQAAASMAAAGVSGIGTGGKGSTSGKSTSGGGFGTSNYGDQSGPSSSPSSASNGIGAGFSSVGDGFSSYGMAGAGTSPGQSAARSGGGTGLSAGYAQAASMGAVGIGGVGGRSIDPVSTGYGSKWGLASRLAQENSMHALDPTYSTSNDKAMAALLGAIARNESRYSWTAKYRDSFADFSQHPGNPQSIPGTGKKSTASGAFQITEPTFNDYATVANVDDFSPKSQTALAKAIAEDRYAKSQVARHDDIYAALEAKDFANVKAALEPTWAALETMTDEQFASYFAEHKSSLEPQTTTTRSADMSAAQQHAYYGQTRSAAPAVASSTGNTPVPTPAPLGRNSTTAVPASFASQVLGFISGNQFAAPPKGNATPASVSPIAGRPALAAASPFASPAAMAAAQRSAENTSIADLATMEAIKSSLSQPTGLSVAQAVAQQEQATAAAEYDDEVQAYNDSFWSRANAEDPVSPELSGEPVDTNDQDDETAKARSFAETYLDGPAEKSGKSKSGDGKRSTGAKIGATVVDIGIGALSPIAGIGNLLGKAATGRSLGERAVDFIGDLEGPSNGIGASYGQGDDGGISLLPEHMEKKQPEQKSKPRDQVSDFGIKYLGWRSDTKRPTPREKWGDRTGYGRREYVT